MDPLDPQDPPDPLPPEPHQELSDRELDEMLGQLQAESERRRDGVDRRTNPRGRRASDQRGSWMPRPPPIETAADFIVIVFACMVVLVLVLLTVGLIVAAFKGGDVKSYFAVITSIMTSVISALVGYLAGRSVGKDAPPP